MTKSTPRHYGDDLSAIHDAGYGDFARAAAGWLVELLGRHQIKGGRIVDLGCGSGILAEALVSAGYQVLGYDLSASMIALARRRAPEATFRAESFVTARISECVCVTAMGEIFNYLNDPRTSDQTLSALFERIHAALAPGGLLVFDGAAPGRAGKSGESRHFATGDDWACMAHAREDRAQRTLSREITAFRRVGTHYRRSDETHILRLFDRKNLLAELRRLGFRVRTIRGYGEMRFPAGYVGFVARKPL